MWADRGAMLKPRLTENINAHLSFAKKHLADPQDFWRNVLQVKNGRVWMTCIPLYLA